MQRLADAEAPEVDQDLPVPYAATADEHVEGANAEHIQTSLARLEDDVVLRRVVP